MPSLPKISDLNPFAEAETRLPGKRVPVMPANASASIASNLAPADQPIALASAVSNSDWSQPGGTASNAPGHLVFNGQGRRAWSVSAGTGSTSRSRLSASPIVYGGRIFVLDAASTVRSFSISTGGRGWQTPLVPEGEAAGESFGGGLAVDDGRLIVATGFGQVVALDPGTGRKLWETSVKVPVRASPTAIGGQIYVIGADGRVFSLSSTDGAELWSFRGLPQTTRRSGRQLQLAMRGPEP
ncbi:MAG: PQQ-binding-like beta-propeller repeat protein, partial [Pseudomonadota bacterium]